MFTGETYVKVADLGPITDRAPALTRVIDELIPAAFHNTGQGENNRCECDHGRLKARLRPMRGLRTNRTASVVIQGQRSFRTCDAATTSWEPTRILHCGRPPHSTNSGWRSDR